MRGSSQVSHSVLFPINICESCFCIAETLHTSLLHWFLTLRNHSAARASSRVGCRPSPGITYTWLACQNPSLGGLPYYIGMAASHGSSAALRRVILALSCPCDRAKAGPYPTWHLCWPLPLRIHPLLAGHQRTSGDRVSPLKGSHLRCPDNPHPNRL